MELTTRRRKLREETRELEDDIKQFEMIGLADELTELSRSKAEVEQELTKMKTDTKLKLGAIHDRTYQVLSLIERRKFARDVVVEIYHDYDTAVMFAIRADTGEEIQRRPLHDHERQMDMNPGVATDGTDRDGDPESDS